MLRAEWKFTYTAKALAHAASDQRAFRQGRIDLWQGKKAEVMQKIKDSGISVTESLADLLSNSPTGKYGSSIGGRGAHITIDATLQADLSECVEKIRTHTSYRDQYNAWVQVLEANPDERLQLDHDDWMFFFGK